MNKLSRTLSGIGLIVFGFVLILFAIIEEIWLLIYGLPSLIIGVFILFNKNEDKIEQIKQKKE